MDQESNGIKGEMRLKLLPDTWKLMMRMSQEHHQEAVLQESEQKAEDCVQKTQVSFVSSDRVGIVLRPGRVDRGKGGLK